MIFIRNLRKHGSGLTLHIPKDIVEDFGLKENDEVSIKPDNGKKGKFIAFWKGGK